MKNTISTTKHTRTRKTELLTQLVIFARNNVDLGFEARLKLVNE